MPAKLGRRDELGLALTLLRWLKGWTQEQTASAAGVSLTGLRALEQGKRRRPTLKTVGPVAATLGANLALVAEVVELIRELRREKVREVATGDAGAPAAIGSPAAITATVAFRRKVTATLIAAIHGRGPEAADLDIEASCQVPSGVCRGEDLGVALTFLRWLREWEQKDLAAASGISLEAIQALEQGRRRRRPPELPSILAALGVDQVVLAKVTSLVTRLRRHQGTVLPALEWAPKAWRRDGSSAFRDHLAGLLRGQI